MGSKFVSAHRQGRIIHCAGCTMGGASAARGPRPTVNFLPRYVDDDWRLKRSSTFWEKQSEPRERKSWVRVWEKSPRLMLVWGPEWLIRPCTSTVIPPAIYAGKRERQQRRLWDILEVSWKDHMTNKTETMSRYKELA